MNTRRTTLAIFIALACTAFGYAQQGSVNPHIGVLVDPTPLPELLTKHLGLKPDQGIRIRNISVGSPADRIGLERDDIIVEFQGQDVNDIQTFVQAVRSAGTDEEVSLEIIHLGQRKTLTFKLALPKGNMEFKYPTEPEVVTSWHPGEIFQLDPNEGKWLEMSLRQLPDLNVDMREFLKERYSFHHTNDGQDYTVTIEGDPKDDQTEVAVKAGQDEYAATVGTLDDLPKEYRLEAKEDVATAVKAAKSRSRFHLKGLPKPPSPDEFQHFFEKIPRPQIDIERWNDRQQRALDRMQKQMERLQERMDQLEKRYLNRQDARENEKGDRPSGDADQTKAASPSSTV